MATIMEKDVLIEAVSGVLAMISKRVEIDAPYTEDQKRFSELRRTIYSSNPEELDFEAIVTECRAARAKYKNVPIRESLK
ncbi:MAG: hypothetical protein Q4D63_02035 [Neisseria animaloris]|nr:hypothetical protein [Neisseria animaloris]